MVKREGYRKQNQNNRDFTTTEQPTKIIIHFFKWDFFKVSLSKSPDQQETLFKYHNVKPNTPAPGGYVEYTKRSRNKSHYNAYWPEYLPYYLHACANIEKILIFIIYIELQY